MNTQNINEVANEISELMMNFDYDQKVKAIFKWNFEFTINGWKTDVTCGLLLPDHSFKLFLISNLIEGFELNSLQVILKNLEHLQSKTRFIEFKS